MTDEIDWYSRIVLSLLQYADRDEPYYEDVTIYEGESEKVRPFFAAALRERTKVYLPTSVGVLLAVFLCSNGEVTRFSVQLSGLLLDLLGAGALGLGLLRSETGIERDSAALTRRMGHLFVGEAGSMQEQNERDLHSVSSEARDAVDGFYGIAFIILGFALQIVALVSF